MRTFFRSLISILLLVLAAFVWYGAYLRSFKELDGFVIGLCFIGVFAVILSVVNFNISSD